MAAGEASTARPRQEKQYDYLLKFLLVGDSDVGKQEILSGLEDGAAESPFCSGSGRTFQCSSNKLSSSCLLDTKYIAR